MRCAMDTTFNSFNNIDNATNISSPSQKTLFFVMAALIIFVDLTSKPMPVGNCPAHISQQQESSQ